MDIQSLVDRAWASKQSGDLEQALKLYNQVYEILIKEASNYAKTVEGTYFDEPDKRKNPPKFFEEADKYLRNEPATKVILNNMGVIFAEVGDKASAEKYFKESIKYTPKDVDYPNPKIGIENL